MTFAALLTALSLTANRPCDSQAAVVPGTSLEAEQLFERGLEAYDRALYEKARSHFEKVSGLPANQRSSAGLLMLGRTLFHLERYDEVRQVMRRLERDYEGSRYSADATLIMGDAFYKEKRYSEAAMRYVSLLRTPPMRVQVSASERLAAVVKNGDMDRSGRARLRATGPAIFDEALLFGEARWYSRLGWLRESRVVMEDYLRAAPEGGFAAAARASLRMSPGSGSPTVQTGRQASTSYDTAIVSDGIKNSRVTVDPSRSRIGPLSLSLEELALSRRPRLGVILPLGGDRYPSAAEVLHGIVMANDEMGRPFDLILADTGEDFGILPITPNEASRLIHTVNATEELISKWGVVALVGPLFSTSCAAAAKIAEAAGVPLIAPLAQQSGLISLGQYIFQLRTVPEVQGQVLAEYATLVLGLQTFAVLAPLTDYGWNFERAFDASARANGGSIVHADWYKPGATDYQLQFDSIRKVGFELISPSLGNLAVLDSLERAMLDTSDAGDEFYLELFGGNVQQIDEPDSSDLSIETIDGIVVVVESFSDAEVIAPQIQFKRLITQVLGNDLWYDPEKLSKMSAKDRANMAQTVIVSGRGINGDVATQFVANFRKLFGNDPGNAAFGYDAAMIVSRGWDLGYRTRDRLHSWLSGLRGFDGASGRISFSNERRVNNELILLKIGADGHIGPVRSVDLPVDDMPDEELPEADLELDF